ncbi:hypothetical protein SJAG_05259 [Schizosaccharomyces japonicus yFS275]|uniref:Uncharacterized protein n=1 Tax=Schizosaccharomyces japonicus (strain yFS275 / FY16936) TaxID=402676 RepID=B6K1U9_SCHJY|nr:hypothetical protein SJAG_05259 [Schizosaccharomyces japonicus yFS275]EEB07130.1 hypothetical protein SJAG_05259 [Schizosaccharomyces japonicus yFS275]
MFAGAGAPSQEQVEKLNKQASAELKKATTIAALLAIAPFAISMFKSKFVK